MCGRAAIYRHNVGGDKVGITRKVSHWVTATIAQVSQASGIPLHLSLGQTDLHSTNYLKSSLEENQVRSSVEMAMMSSPGVVLDLV